MLEEDGQDTSQDRVEQEAGLPLLVFRHAQNAVTNVMILVEHVGEGVVLEIVGLFPGRVGAGVVPVKNLGVNGRITHPVVLAVHHVMADFHVVQDLGGRQTSHTGQPCRRQETRHQQAAPGNLQATLTLDQGANIGGIFFAQVRHFTITNGVQFLANGLELFGAQVTENTHVLSP